LVLVPSFRFEAISVNGGNGAYVNACDLNNNYSFEATFTLMA